MENSIVIARSLGFVSCMNKKERDPFVDIKLRALMNDADRKHDWCTVAGIIDAWRDGYDECSFEYKKYALSTKKK